MNKSTEVNTVTEDKFLKGLQEFRKHLNASAMEMLDVINAGGDYQERFDVKIECNGKSIQIDLHADIFSRLEGLLDAEIEEYVELKEADENEAFDKLQEDTSNTLDEIDRAMEAGDFETAKRLQDEFLDNMLAGVE